MTNLGLSSTSDVITFDQNWHHLYSTSAGGKDLCNDAQIRGIGVMESEICTKMFKKWSEKLRPKFPASMPGCSMVKIACLGDVFLEVFRPQARPVEGQSLQQKEKKKKRQKNQKWKSLKAWITFSCNLNSQNFDFCAHQSPNVKKRNYSDKKGKLSCC